MKRKAIIISIAGLKLSLKERKLIQKEKPWGIILFRRNIKTISQVKKLTQSIRKCINDKVYPILIDEEGSRVTRLSAIFNNKFPQRFFGDLYKLDQNVALKIYEHYIISVIKTLKNLGININTVPVLDKLSTTTHQIIGNRSFSNDTNIINDLGKLCVKVYNKKKISTVMKHIPGHGSANSDSHLTMPIVNKSYKYLENNDFICFKNINSKIAMTAHILYKNIDSQNCATQSNYIISNVIRKKLGFKGLLVSDDIAMKALKSDLINNAIKSLNAGCNIVLYCTGKYHESVKLLKNVPYIDNFTQKKTSELYRFLR